MEHLSVPGTKTDREMLQGYAQIYARQIGDLIMRMPRPLLLLLKTNDCLRSVDLSLGQPVNTFVITARECTRALADMEWERKPSVGTWLHGQVDMWRVEFIMLAMRAMTWLAMLRAAVLGPQPPRTPRVLPKDVSTTAHAAVIAQQQHSCGSSLV